MPQLEGEIQNDPSPEKAQKDIESNFSKDASTGIQACPRLDNQRKSMREFREQLRSFRFTREGQSPFTIDGGRNIPDPRPKP
jgi:hypothetical protein